MGGAVKMLAEGNGGFFRGLGAKGGWVESEWPLGRQRACTEHGQKEQCAATRPHLQRLGLNPGFEKVVLKMTDVENWV